MNIKSTRQQNTTFWWLHWQSRQTRTNFCSAYFLAQAQHFQLTLCDDSVWDLFLCLEDHFWKWKKESASLENDDRYYSTAVSGL